MVSRANIEVAEAFLHHSRSMAVVGVGVAQVGVGESPNSVLEDIPLACQKENLTFCFWAD